MLCRSEAWIIAIEILILGPLKVEKLYPIFLWNEEQVVTRVTCSNVTLRTKINLL
jgi:hypothetical protein